MSYILNKKLKDEELEKCFHNLTFSFTLDGPPENYTRERYSKFSGFYNKKGGKMKKLNSQVLDRFLYNKEYQIVKELLKSKDNFYFVELNMKFFIPVCKSDSNKTINRKTSGIYRPTQRPDTDNYTKFIFDSLHNIFYDDDCRIVKESSEKVFGITGKTEVTVKITYYSDDK